MRSDSDSAQSEVTNRPQRARKMKRVVSPSGDPPTFLPPHQLRTPAFWPEKPAIWFAQVECQFFLNGITDDATRFYHISSKLDREYAAELEDVNTGPHKVLTREKKVFKIDVKGKSVTVSIDRLKPAYILHDSHTSHNTSPHLSVTHANTHISTHASTQPHTRTQTDTHASTHTDTHKDTQLCHSPFRHTTRSGRHVRFPDYYRP